MKDTRSAGHLYPIRENEIWLAAEEGSCVRFNTKSGMFTCVYGNTDSAIEEFTVNQATQAHARVAKEMATVEGFNVSESGDTEVLSALHDAVDRAIELGLIPKVYED